MATQQTKHHSTYRSRSEGRRHHPESTGLRPLKTAKPYVVGAMGVTVLVALGFLVHAFAGDNRTPTTPEKRERLPVTAETINQLSGKGLAALKQAADAKKYLFVFFYKTDDAETQAARRSWDENAWKFADRAEFASVNVTDPAEQRLVNQYGLGRAPLPLVLAFAPNGAVTRSLVKNFDETQLAMAFVGPSMEKCIKALQDRKMVFVCVQNDTTPQKAEAMQGVKEFAADAQYARTTEIITVDPADAAEAGFLQQLKVDPRATDAVTIFLAPPGTMVGTYKGKTKKEALVAAVRTAAQGCAPGSTCAPGSSCGPAPKKP